MTATVSTRPSQLLRVPAIRATIAPMPTRPGRRSAIRLVLAAVLAVTAFASMALAPATPSAAALSRWTGSIDLYRTGVFTTQRSWLWCTAADVQIMRNIVHRQTDHATSSQRRYFDYMRAHNRYPIPVSDGVDPAGWTAGLRRLRRWPLPARLER